MTKKAADQTLATFNCDRALWAAFKLAAKSEGSNATRTLTALIQDYMGDGPSLSRDDIGIPLDELERLSREDIGIPLDELERLSREDIRELIDAAIQSHEQKLHLGVSLDGLKASALILPSENALKQAIEPVAVQSRAETSALLTAGEAYRALQSRGYRKVSRSFRRSIAQAIQSGAIPEDLLTLGLVADFEIKAKGNPNNNSLRWLKLRSAHSKATPS